MDDTAAARARARASTLKLPHVEAECVFGAQLGFHGPNFPIAVVEAKDNHHPAVLHDRMPDADPVELAPGRTSPPRPRSS